MSLCSGEAVGTSEPSKKEGDMGRTWGRDEKRSSTMVFIGRDLPEDLIVKGLEQCLVATQ